LDGECLGVLSNPTLVAKSCRQLGHCQVDVWTQLFGQPGIVFLQEQTLRTFAANMQMIRHSAKLASSAQAAAVRACSHS